MSPCLLVTQRRKPGSRRRLGYTLLEVLLAIAIGLLLVAALYVAVDVQFRYMHTGRNAVVEGQLARGLFNRMAKDVRLSLASLPSRTAASSSTTQPASTSDTGTSATETDTGSATTTAPTGQFNLGILGDEYSLTLYISTLPRYGRDEAIEPVGLSDLRRITYWLEPGLGLVRKEVLNVLNDGLQEDQGPTEVLAEEVLDVRFRYFDPSLGDWVTTWDGSTSGPPLAVEITLTIEAQTSTMYGARREQSSYRMVVGIPSAAVPQSLVNSQTGVTQ